MSPDDQNRQSFYDEIAGSYHRRRYETLYGRLFRLLHHGVLREALNGLAGGRLLEVACGTGHTTELLRAMQLDFIACDLTPGMLAQLRSRLGGDLPVIRANAMRLPFADEAFDGVISTRFLHLFAQPDQQALLIEMVRVLKPGGKLLVDFDNLVSRWFLAVPHLLYNVVRYRRLAPDTHYNRIPAVEQALRRLNLGGIRSVGVGGYHLVVPAALSFRAALRAGVAHRHRPWRSLAEQFVVIGTKLQ